MEFLCLSLRSEHIFQQCLEECCHIELRSMCCHLAIKNTVVVAPSVVRGCELRHLEDEVCLVLTFVIDKFQFLLSLEGR